MDGDGDMGIVSASQNDDTIAWYENNYGGTDSAPTVASAIANVSVNIDASNTVIDLGSVFTDSDNDNSVIMKTVLSNTNQSLVTTSISGNNLTLDYQASQSGTATIIIQGTSNGVHVTDAFTVTVTHAPVITSNGGGSSASISYTENSTSAVTTVTSSDEDSGDSATYSVTGTDAGDFSINPGIGTLTFTSAPDYEIPVDADQNNTYSITITVTDGGTLADSQDIIVTVNNVNDTPPTITSNGGGSSASISIMEGASKSVTIVTSTDLDDITAITVHICYIYASSIICICINTTGRKAGGSNIIQICRGYNGNRF
jgi:hypothetical protein